MAGRLTQPGEQLASHLIAIDFVEEFMPGLGIGTTSNPPESCNTIGGEKLFKPHFDNPARTIPRWLTLLTPKWGIGTSMPERQTRIDQRMVGWFAPLLPIPSEEAGSCVLTLHDR
jgi:hypothetical protein